MINAELIDFPRGLRHLALLGLATLLTACGEFEVRIEAYAQETQGAGFDVPSTAGASRMVASSRPPGSGTPFPGTSTITGTASGTPVAAVFTPGESAVGTPSQGTLSPCGREEGLMVEGFVYQNVDASQGGIPNVEIYLEIPGDEGSPYLVATTEAQGAYRTVRTACFTRAGTVVSLQARRGEEVFAPESLSIELAGGIDNRRIDFVAAQTVRVDGYVAEDRGQRMLSDVSMLVRIGSGPAEPLTTTDAGGGYTLSFPAPLGGRIELKPSLEGYLFVPAEVTWDNDRGQNYRTEYFVGSAVGAGQLAFAGYGYDDRGEPTDQGIWVVEPQAGATPSLIAFSGTEQQPAWSPDGRRIAFARGGYPFEDIYVMNADGSGLTRLTSTSSREVDPAWSPDGARIAFASDREGDLDIYVMQADGSGLTRLTASLRWEYQPAWSPDGERILFVSENHYASGDRRIFVINADGSAEAQFTDGTSWAWSPAWSPDGGRIAFVCGLSDNAQICVVNADGSGLVRLTEVGAVDSPTWSPDGRWIAYIVSRGALTDVRVMNADGRDNQRLLADMHVFDVDWGP